MHWPLNGTYIKMRVSKVDKARYQNHKGEIGMNLLAACSKGMQYMYVISGWEGSAADSTVLSDAVTQRNGLKIPHGKKIVA